MFFLFFLVIKENSYLVDLFSIDEQGNPIIPLIPHIRGRNSYRKDYLINYQLLLISKAYILCIYGNPNVRGRHSQGKD